MLRVTLDVNGKIIGELKIVRDPESEGRFRDYTAKLRGEDMSTCRVEQWDSQLGPWNLVQEAIKATHWQLEEIDAAKKKAEELAALFGIDAPGTTK